MPALELFWLRTTTVDRPVTKYQKSGKFWKRLDPGQSFQKWSEQKKDGSGKYSPVILQMRR